MQNKFQESESRLKAIIENCIDGIITIDKRGIIESFNPAAGKIFGYRPEEVIDKNIKMLMPEPDKSKHDTYLENYHRTGEGKIIGIGREVVGLKKDGTRFPFKLSVSEVHLTNRTIYTGMVHDISEQKLAEEELRKMVIEKQTLNEELEKRVANRTEELEITNRNLQEQIKDRRKIEEALRESQKLYNAIAKNFPNGAIIVLDHNLEYIFVEGKELDDLGISSERMLGEQIFHSYNPEERKLLQGHLKKVYQGKNASFETVFKGRNYMNHAVPLPDAKGEINFILLVLENITDRKQAEKKNQEALDKERELNELKSTFVSIASHEFRTPLSTILSSASLIGQYQQEDQQEKRLKHIDRIKSSVANLTQILNDFLSLTKLEEGRVEHKPEKFGIEKFSREICQDMQAIAKPGQHIVYQHNGNIDQVNLDKNFLKNILINLISNAIKYSGEGQNINFSTELNDHQLNIFIRDNGIGIPKEEQHHLFDRFFRARNATNIQGTGLGMNIVKRYLDLMKGSIEFDSQLNTGTTFKITIPANGLNA